MSRKFIPYTPEEIQENKKMVRDWLLTADHALGRVTLESSPLVFQDRSGVHEMRVRIQKILTTL
jgi:hypothetical protein